MINKFEGEFDFLSNHYPSTFFYKGIKYKSVTHAYQSLKCKYDTDAIVVRNCITPEEALKKARESHVRDDWQDICRSVMKELLCAKFDNPFLRPRLLKTKGLQLGNGRNFVGALLMEIRDETIDKK